MKHVIIGTAGHVDHGKSSLIKALTGVNPDRLKEEQKRGITIELGFTYLDLPDGSKAGIIDVPGHERFVHNMLAGAGGIDLAILVIAADEGVMPQTEEHLEILRLLDIKHGIVVLSKTDLVDEEWLELVEETVRESVVGTFFESSPVYKASAYSGEGIAELRTAIFDAIEALPEKDPELPFREPIDRVFSVEGFGTVVTGTVFEGQVAPGDTLMVYPEEREVRVRNVQVHDEDVDKAYAGQRTAINLAQIAKEDLERGQVLAAPGSLDLSKILDVKVSLAAKAPFSVKNRSRVHFHYGAQENVAQVRLLDREELLAGETTVARLNFQEPVVLKYGDPFVLRFFSPTVTIGGGHVLDPCPQTYKVKNAPWHEHLSGLAQASAKERLLAAIDSASPFFHDVDEALRRSGLAGQPAELGAATIRELETAGQIHRLTRPVYISQHFLDNMAGAAKRILSDFHERYPLKLGLRRESLRTGLLPEVNLDLSDKILQLLIEQGSLKEQNGLLSQADFSLALSPEQAALEDEILAVYQKAGFAPPNVEELAEKFPQHTDLAALLSHLIDSERLIRLDDKLNIHPAYLQKARDFVIQTIQREGSLKLADFRDFIDSSRRYALAILDYFDRSKLTRMQGDVRKLL